MKKIFCIFSVLLITACQTYPLDLIVIPEAKENLNFPNLELKFEPNKTTSKSNSIFEVDVKQNTNHLSLFYREFEKNVITSEGEKKGSIILTPIYQTVKVNMGWMGLSGAGLFIPNILGMPISSYTSSCKLDLKIEDKYKTLIKVYNSTSTVTRYAAAYWGYYFEDGTNAAIYDCYKETLNDLIQQMNNDRNFIAEKLSKQEF